MVCKRCGNYKTMVLDLKQVRHSKYTETETVSLCPRCKSTFGDHFNISVQNGKAEVW